MSAASIFIFKFTAETASEGMDIATAVGVDMTKTNGYTSHSVIKDVADPGQVAVVTFWNEQSQGEAVLSEYINDDKIKRATELAGAAPTGFLGLA